MASNIYKVKVTYKQGNLAATETYFSQPFELSNTGAAPFVARLNTLLQLRTNMMFTSHKWVSVDIANVDDPHRTWLMRPGNRAFPVGGPNIVNVPIEGTLTITSVSRRPEQLRVAVLTEFTFDTGHRRSRRFVSTCPDDVTNFDDQTLLQTSATDWWPAFTAWGSEMSSGYWQIHAKRNDAAFARKQVQGLLTQAAAPSLLGLQMVASDVTADWTPGTSIDVSGFRAFPGVCPCPTINGRWVIDSVNSTLVPGSSIVFLKGSSSIDPKNWKIMGFAQLRGFGYFVVEGVEATGTATHKRGNGLRRRGKQKATCCPR